MLRKDNDLATASSDSNNDPAALKELIKELETRNKQLVATNKESLSRIMQFLESLKKLKQKVEKDDKELQIAQEQILNLTAELIELKASYTRQLNQLCKLNPDDPQQNLDSAEQLKNLFLALKSSDAALLSAQEQVRKFSSDGSLIGSENAEDDQAALDNTAVIVGLFQDLKDLQARLAAKASSLEEQQACLTAQATCQKEQQARLNAEATRQLEEGRRLNAEATRLQEERARLTAEATRQQEQQVIDPKQPTASVTSVTSIPAAPEWVPVGEQKEEFNSFDEIRNDVEKENQFSHLCDKVIAAITRYKEEKVKSRNFFSQLFASDRGINRAKTYLNAFTNIQSDVQRKLLIYALLASNDGPTLKKAVATAIGIEALAQDEKMSPAKQFAQTHLQDLLTSKDETKKIDKLVGKIVYFANTPRIRNNEFKLPENIWEELNSARKIRNGIN